MKFNINRERIKIQNLFELFKNTLKSRFNKIKNFKRKRLIKYSFYSGAHLKKYFPLSFNMEKLRDIFFEKNLFSYIDLNQKDKIIELLNKECSTIVQKYVDSAEAIINKNFFIFEKPISKSFFNWHKSFFGDYIWKKIPSDLINIYPADQKIDVKYVWELNRHNYLSYLGVAYYITNDEKYAIEFRDIILDWIKKNPPLIGINWYSGLEISVRLVSWIFSIYFFKDSKIINNNQFFSKILSSMLHHALYLKFYYIKNSFNHTIGDMFGVYLFSKIFEEIPLFKKWERKFFIKLCKQISLQTRTDGTNIEQSVNYHRFVLEFFSLFLLINQNQLKRDDRKLIESMFDYLKVIIKPDHTFPCVGDTDDGKVLLLTFFKENSFLDLINLGCILFQKGTLKEVSKHISPISILLFGKDCFKSFFQIKTAESSRRLEYFKDAGYIVIRNGWTPTSNYLFVDFGRPGPRTAPHWHSSITNFIFSYKGKNIFIDSGTYTYNKSWEERNYFRSSKAHNVLTINNNNQAIASDWFSWEYLPKLKRLIKLNGEEIYLSCLHDGYRGFITKREFFTNKDLNYIKITDTIYDSNGNSLKTPLEVDIYYHFGEAVNIEIKEKELLVDQELKIIISSQSDYDMKIQKSCFSPFYGDLRENLVLKISSKHKRSNIKSIQFEVEIKPLN